GFYVVRLPISGGRGFPCDVLAAKGDDRRAYQVKDTAGSRVYIKEDDVALLLNFSRAFGFKAYVAVRWKRRRKNRWTVIEILEAKPLKISYASS
ncbi:MAG TPA: hypothetical protein ENG81_01905, partial [Candidatus Bathyarchaeota archaeon]|nr:hypothetical protein [Candidatus Bathyarchaeota archaeon]